MSTPILKVENLEVSLMAGETPLPIVRDLSFEIPAGETLCLVGESGCGKSLTALAVIGLLGKGLGVTKGRILFEGRDLAKAHPEEVRKLRGERISMIFQEPMTSLNPVMRIGRQIGEVIEEHRGISAESADAEAARLLDLVRIPDAASRARAYPHEMSGGMRQRAMIAMALALNPTLLIADEPTTALDVTIQAQVLNLMADLRSAFNTSLLLITHDLGVVAEMADRVLVLYAGRRVEEAPVGELFDTARHPYTQGLIRSVTQLFALDKVARLDEIKGVVPVPTRAQTGCVFRDRCTMAIDRCAQTPPAISCGQNHEAACWLIGDHEVTA